jgi:hypothetical protein
MPAIALIFALVLFGLGLWIVLDDLRFRVRSRRAFATVLSTEKVQRLISEGQDSNNRYRQRKHVSWKTRYSFRAGGRDYTNEGEFDSEPGSVVSIWYDRADPRLARTFKSKVAVGWNLLIASLIPFGFWLIDIGVIPLP